MPILWPMYKCPWLVFLECSMEKCIIDQWEHMYRSFILFSFWEHDQVLYIYTHIGQVVMREREREREINGKY